ncbi:MAG: hypothetical protein AB199_01985 [Parcubacteria bacterium C7867-004]|nr:MAG: hypothetical protein AB199_01985 [Parcubacteria bacterium C7867-004]
MNKQLTRKQFLLFVGSLIGVFVLSNIPGASRKASNGSYGNGSYGGTPSA